MEVDFRKVFSDLLVQVAKREWGLIGIQIVLSVVVPAGISYAVNLVTGDNPEIKIIGGWFLCFFIAIQAILLIATLLGPSTPARAIVALDTLNNTYEELKEKHGVLNSQRDSYYSSVFCANQSLEVVRGILDSGDIEVTDSLLKDHLERILRPYVVNKDLVFNFGQAKAKALYRITVLLYQDTKTGEGELKQRYSYLDPGIVKRNRSWTRKTGHAGRAFTEEKVIITPDLSTIDEYRDYYDEIDKRQYRSMASIPLLNKGSVCGVVVITGSEPDQFDYNKSVEIFETIGHTLSLYLGYTKSAR